MSSSSNAARRVAVVEGDLLKSQAQTLVNTVNCVGVMGKGVALAFKKRYPRMYVDYVRRCDQHQVKLGRPYVYKADDRLIVNFPTKQHWRAVSRLEDIVEGLEYLKQHYRAWGITSLAVPPLGCGNGQLEWDVVGPTLYRHLAELDIPVELYVPHGVKPEQKQLSFFEADGSVEPRQRFVDPEWVALVGILNQLEQQPYHWPVGRVMFQKIAYFATCAGLPTGLKYEAASYGPYSPSLKPAIARLQNNGLLAERQRSRMFEVLSGPTFSDAFTKFDDVIRQWGPMIDRVVDLVARFDSKQAEVASSVHFAAEALKRRFDRPPYASEVVDEVERWKLRRNPKVTRPEILQAIEVLGRRRWVEIQPDAVLTEYVDEFEYV